MRLYFNILTTKGYKEVYGYKIYKNFSCYRKGELPPAKAGGFH